MATSTTTLSLMLVFGLVLASSVNEAAGWSRSSWYRRRGLHNPDEFVDLAGGPVTSGRRRFRPGVVKDLLDAPLSDSEAARIRKVSEGEAAVPGAIPVLPYYLD